MSREVPDVHIVFADVGEYGQGFGKASSSDTRHKTSPSPLLELASRYDVRSHDEFLYHSTRV